MRANFPDVLDHRQVQNIIGILKLWTPDATARILSATQFDSERVAVEKEEEKGAWNNILDQYERDELPQRQMHTVLGRTPRILQKCGATDLPIKISKKSLDKITKEKHNVPVLELRKLLTEIDSPMAVFKSRSAVKIKSLVVLTALKDADNGENAIVAIHLGVLEGRAQGRRVNSVASVYGKKPSGLKKLIDEGKVLYVDKEKSHEFERSNQLQLLAEALNRGRILTEEDVVDGVISGDNVNRNFEKPFHPVRWIKQGGEVFGWFNPNTGEIVLREGCSATSVMEALWHTTFNFAEASAPKLHSKMRKFARNAPHDIRDAVGEVYPELKAGSEVWVEKVGAVFFSREHVRKLKKLLKANRQSLFSKVLHTLGRDRVNLKKLSELPSKKAVAALANAFARRKHLVHSH